MLPCSMIWSKGKGINQFYLLVKREQFVCLGMPWFAVIQGFFAFELNRFNKGMFGAETQHGVHLPAIVFPCACSNAGSPVLPKEHF